MKKFIRFWRFFARQRPTVYGRIYFAIIPTFALLFFLIQGFHGVKLSFFESLYFSVVTITTLGYGDISPDLPLTRFVAASESVLGVVMIGLFLSALSHVRSTEQVNEEVERSKAHDRKLATTGVRKHNILLKPLLERYLGASNHLSTKHGDSPRIFTQGFPISNFTEIFEPSFLLKDAPYRPKIEYYFETQQQLRSELERLLISVDLSYWPELQECIMQWLSLFTQYDYSKKMLDKPNMYVGDEPMIQIDKEMLEKFDGEIIIQGSNSMDPYCALYIQLDGLYQLTQRVWMSLNTILS